MSTKVEEFQRKLPEFLTYQIYKNKLRIYENTKKFLKQLISKYQTVTPFMKVNIPRETSTNSYHFTTCELRVA